MILHSLQKEYPVTVDYSEAINFGKAFYPLSLWRAKFQSLTLVARTYHNDFVKILQYSDIVTAPNQIFCTHHSGSESIQLLSEVTLEHNKVSDDIFVGVYSHELPVGTETELLDFSKSFDKRTFVLIEFSQICKVAGVVAVFLEKEMETVLWVSDQQFKLT